MIKNLPTNKTPATNGLTHKFYQTFTEELISTFRKKLTSILLKLFRKTAKEQSQSYSMMPPQP